MAIAVEDQSKDDQVVSTDPNRDPISGEPGAHPIGTGLGAAVGGATAGVLASLAAWAVGGIAAGPVVTTLGLVLGGVAGGLAGKGIAESIDPTDEDAFRREDHEDRPCSELSTAYDHDRLL